jgi:cysteine-rich repeat protein
MNNIKHRALTIGTILLASASFLATSAPFEDDCENRLDDDGDGRIDLADEDCQFTLIPEPACGDGDTESDEVCDDGNNISGDGCRADCRGLEVCGDGLADTLSGEACDDATQAEGDVCADDCSAITGNLFVVSQNINNTNPSNANVVVFGESNVGESRMLMIVASSDAAICDSIGAATATDINGEALTGFAAFFQNTLDGQESGPTVFISAEKIADTTPFSAPQVFAGDAETLAVDGGFIVGDGAQTIVDTLFGGGFEGALSLHTLDATTIQGQYEGLQLFEFVTGTEIDESLRGIFSGSHCQAVSDGLISVFGQ